VCFNTFRVRDGRSGKWRTTRHKISIFTPIHPVVHAPEIVARGEVVIWLSAYQQKTPDSTRLCQWHSFACGIKRSLL
jgi:hypothetical protein